MDPAARFDNLHAQRCEAPQQANSTGCSCCGSSLSVLASNRMMILPNSPRRSVALFGAPPSPFPNPAIGRDAMAGWPKEPLCATPAPPHTLTGPCRHDQKLELFLSITKQSICNFLIDSFRAFSMQLSGIENFTYDFFNRQYVELDSLVSCRKQTIGPISNRHKITFCNSARPFAESSHA